MQDGDDGDNGTRGRNVADSDDDDHHTIYHTTNEPRDVERDARDIWGQRDIGLSIS
jgi:hypothetical protein